MRSYLQWNRRCYSSLYDGPSKPVEALVHDMYMRMNMMLAES